MKKCPYCAETILDRRMAIAPCTFGVNGMNVECMRRAMDFLTRWGLRLG